MVGANAPGGTGATRRLETVGVAVVVVAGTLLHFCYDWSGANRVVAVFAPVNESVWEHLKLVLFPLLAYAAVEARRVPDPRALWWAKLAEVVAASVFIVGFFYGYTGALGVDSVVAVDIASFCVAVALGQALSYRLLTHLSRRRPPAVVALAALVGVVVLFGVCTFAPPHLPLFQEASTGRFGPA